MYSNKFGRVATGLSEPGRPVASVAVNFFYGIRKNTVHFKIFYEFIRYQQKRGGEEEIEYKILMVFSFFFFFVKILESFVWHKILLKWKFMVQITELLKEIRKKEAAY